MDKFLMYLQSYTYWGSLDTRDMPTCESVKHPQGAWSPLICTGARLDDFASVHAEVQRQMLFDMLVQFMHSWIFFLDFSGSFLSTGSINCYKAWIPIALIDIPELFQSASTQGQGVGFFHTADPV